MKHYVILGAGVSGLSLGWFLKRRFGSHIRLTILEQANRTGGWVQTDIVEGCLFESGPRSLRSKGSGLETLRLIEQLNIQNQVITANPKAKYRYLFSRGKLRKLPTGPFSMLTSPMTRSVPWILLREYFRKKGSLPDESIFSFMTRRFSSHCAENLLDPLTTGIYAGDIKKLSIRSCFPMIHQWEMKYGSVCKGLLLGQQKKRRISTPFLDKFSQVPLFSFKDGMETLTDALSDVLTPHIRLNSGVKSLQFQPHQVEIELEDGNVLKADHIFSALPSSKLSLLFKSQHRELSTLLMSISGASVAVVNLGYFRKVLKRKGFGYLVPSCEKEKVLGCVFDSNIFPEQNQIPEETRLTVMMGGTHQPSLIDLSKNDLKELALNSLKRHLGIESEPNVVSVKIARSAIPQYFVGHMKKIDRIGTILARIFPRMTLTGNSFLGVSVNDCIANSKRIEESLIL